MLCRRRWAQFRLSFDEIDAKVRALVNGETVSYRQHIGGAHYISVTTGFRCVDFRKFYMPYGQKDIKPTLKGVALRLQKWGEMRKVMESIDKDNPSLATAVPCYLQDDHQNQMGSPECKECSPFVDNLDQPLVNTNNVA